jgi:hypothetical protein
MINPNKITDYNRNEWDLQEFFFFAVAVQGKNSQQTARKVQALVDHISEMFVENPFYEKVKPETGIIHYLLGEQDEGSAGINLLKEFKFGKYNQWEKFIDHMKHLKWLLLDPCHMTIGEWLMRSDYVEIETIPSVGKKTSRFFKLHSDLEARCVPLDTHILKFVREKHCHDADSIPKSTPTSATKYYEIENLALTYMGNYISQSRTCDTIAKADLEIWRSYANV